MQQKEKTQEKKEKVIYIKVQVRMGTDISFPMVGK
jgi:hypothetical protein